MRNMVLENLDDQPEKVQGFEANLATAMTEFQIRSERVVHLEGELSSLRKEMEAKMAIISGLTRERSSMKASPLDMSAIATIQEQLMESENKIRILSETHAAREKELLDQVDQLKSSLGSQETPRSSIPSNFPESVRSSVRGVSGESFSGDNHDRQVAELQREVADWRSKHDSAMSSMKASEAQLLATITDLEVNLRNAEQHSRSVSPEETPEAHDLGRKRQDEAIAVLQKELEHHKTTAANNATRLSELEQSYNKILGQVEEDSRSKDLTEQELEMHRNLVSNLESQIETHKSSIESHQQSLDTLRAAHSKEIDEAKAEVLKAQKEADEKLNAAVAEHNEKTTALQTELEQARSSNGDANAALEAEVAKSKQTMQNLLADAAMILNKPTNPNNLTAHLQALVNARKDIGALHETATSELNDVRQELETYKSKTTDHEKNLAELKELNQETFKELEVIKEKEQKSSRLVEELEEQLNSNFDQTQAANHRLSALQTERQLQIDETLEAKAEVEKELEESRNKIAQLEVCTLAPNSIIHISNPRQAQLSETTYASYRESQDPRDADLQRSNSGNGANSGRKSVPAANLPSPPPAIPLPPLPGAPGSNGPSPPTSRHQSKDIAAAQVLEDQEARIRTIEKHLFAEKQLTATLEEALTDLESSSTKMKSEMEAWRRKCSSLEDELMQLRKEKANTRLSVQQMEDDARRRIEQERAKLEERMQQLNSMTKKQKTGKKGSLNCF
jgi:chromosome segregation ATPase